MGKKITEKELIRLVKEQVKKVLNDKVFKISDYWDVNSFTQEQLRQLKTNLRTFIRGCGFGSPVFYDGEKLQVTETFERISQPIDKVKADLMEKLHFHDWQIVEDKGTNNVRLIVLYADIDYNEDILINEMKALGWSKSYIDKPLRNGDIVVKAISFDPMYPPSIASTVRQWRALYHLSPEYNEKSILANGLIPASQNLIFDYPPRIHFLKPNTCDAEKYSIAYELNKANRNPKNNGIYCLFLIDTDKVPANVEFHYDPHYENGIYTTQSIPPCAIKLLFKFSCSQKLF